MTIVQQIIMRVGDHNQIFVIVYSCSKILFFLISESVIYDESPLIGKKSLKKITSLLSDVATNVSTF